MAAACDAGAEPAMSPARAARAPEAGRVVLALEADACAASCVETLRVTLYDDADPTLPLGPPLQAACSDDLLISSLPAGLTVRATVEAYDAIGAAILSGTSAPITIAADRTTALELALTAVAPPILASASPDPFVLGGASPLVVTGTGLGPYGAHGVTLGGAAATATFEEAGADGGADAVTVTPAASSTGSEITVTSCGVTSAPLPVRLVGASAGFSALAPIPACAGGRAVAAATIGDATLIARACDDPSQATLFVVALGCPPALIASHPLGANPVAMAATPTHAGLALETGAILRLDDDALTATPSVAATLTAAPRALAATADAVHVLTAPPDAYLLALAATGDPAETSLAFPELEHTAMAALGDTLVLAATTASGDGRLVLQPAAGTPTASPLPCDAPHAVVASRTALDVAVLCDDGLVLWNATTGAGDAVAAAQSAVFDSVGDVLLAVRGDTLDLLSTMDGGMAPLASLPLGGTPSTLHAELGAHRLLAESGGALGVLTPYDPDGPCEAAE